MELFTFLTGVIYIILEIRQKNLMWAVGILTSLAAMWVFFSQGLYASFSLNVYYLITAVIGLWQWGRDKDKIAHSGDSTIHLRRLTPAVMVLSLIAVAGGTFGLAAVMELLENPMSYLDSMVAMLSAVATWWLVRSYIQQWWLWIAANSMTAVLCAVQGLWWMTVLYTAYVVSSVIGYVHWKRHGVYVSECSKKEDR